MAPDSKEVEPLVSEKGSEEESSDEESRGPRRRVKAEIEEYPFEHNVFMLLMLRLGRYWDRHTDEKAEPTGELIARLLLAIVLFIINIGMKVLVMGFVYEVASSQLDADFNHKSFLVDYNITMHQAVEALRNGVAAGSASAMVPVLGKALDDPTGILQKCDIQHDVPTTSIYYVMLFWWIVFMLKEFKSIRVWFTALCHVEKRKNRSEPLWEENHLVRLDSWMRGIFIVIVPLAKLLIAIPLTYAGCKFLILQTIPFAIVMKVLALQLVINVDELLVQGLSTRVCSEQVSKAKVNANIREFKKLLHWDSGVGGLCYIIFAVVCVLSITEGVYGDLMAFRRSCNAYYKAFGGHRALVIDPTHRLLFEI